MAKHPLIPYLLSLPDVSEIDWPMKWTDAAEIALALIEGHPDVDPLALRFTTLREWVIALPGFDDDPAASSERRLEAIQMAWYEERQA